MFKPRTAEQFIDSLRTPVFLLAADGAIRAANKKALALVGKTGAQIAGLFPGQVLECVYAEFPGGCGKTEHCQACTIRNAILTTVRTGQSVSGARAYQHVATPQGVLTRLFTVSTEKFQTSVLLKIEEVEEGSWAAAAECL